jgi:hypothetical protein
MSGTNIVAGSSIIDKNRNGKEHKSGKGENDSPSRPL